MLFEDHFFFPLIKWTMKWKFRNFLSTPNKLFKLSRVCTNDCLETAILLDLDCKTWWYHNIHFLTNDLGLFELTNDSALVIHECPYKCSLCNKKETFATMKDSYVFFVKSHMTIKENMEIWQWIMWDKDLDIDQTRSIAYSLFKLLI